MLSNSQSERRSPVQESRSQHPHPPRTRTTPPIPRTHTPPPVHTTHPETTDSFWSRLNLPGVQKFKFCCCSLHKNFRFVHFFGVRKAKVFSLRPRTQKTLPCIFSKHPLRGHNLESIWVAVLSLQGKQVVLSCFQSQSFALYQTEPDFKRKNLQTNPAFHSTLFHLTWTGNRCQIVPDNSWVARHFLATFGSARCFWFHEVVCVAELRTPVPALQTAGICSHVLFVDWVRNCLLESDLVAWIGFTHWFLTLEVLRTTVLDQCSGWKHDRFCCCLVVF